MLISKKSIIENELEQIKTNLKLAKISLTEGKLIRSKFGLLILKSIDIEPTDDYLYFFTAIELIHNASLLHDDVIDNDTERRGKPTINKEFDSKTAILYGNILVSNAFNYLLKIKNIELLHIANNTIQRMCDGELIQKSQEFKIPTIEEYLTKTRLKTASLFECVTNGILNISQRTDLYYLNETSKNFGIAFQIRNDLNNNSKTDIKNGIYTAPIIYSNSTNITHDAIEKTLSLIDNYTRRAIESLNNLRDSEYKSSLIGVIKCLNK